MNKPFKDCVCERVRWYITPKAVAAVTISVLYLVYLAH